MPAVGWLSSGQFQLFDPEDYEGQSGAKVVSPRRKQETDEYLTMKQQRQSGWPRQYGERT